MVKNKYDTLDNLPGEVLTDIRALADQFLITFPNINSTSPLRCNSKTLIHIFQRELDREGSLEWICLFRVLATREVEIV